MKMLGLNTIYEGVLIRSQKRVRLILRLSDQCFSMSSFVAMMLVPEEKGASANWVSSVRLEKSVWQQKSVLLSLYFMAVLIVPLAVLTAKRAAVGEDITYTAVIAGGSHW